MINKENSHSIKAVAMAVCLCIFHAQPMFSQTRDLSVSIQGFRSDEGRCLVLLFDKPDGFPKKPENALHKLNCRIVKGLCSFMVRDLHPGSYAVSVLHDENNNGKLDMSWYGKPKEGVGASNNAKGLFGPPGFQQASVRLNQDTTIRIQMRYY